jgi:HSP20 family protein
MGAMPAVDVAETDKAYEITAEFAGAKREEHRGEAYRRVLNLKGEKQQEKQEKKKDYYLGRA